MLLQPGSRPVPNCPDYVLVGKLGAGAFGEVWQGNGPGGIDVALKFIRLSEHGLAMELRSIEAVKSVRHPNLVSLFGVWKTENWLILAMELCDCSLLDLLAEAQARKHSGIPLPTLLGCMSDAANGLDALNAKQVQHRDVKPANLLLLNSGVKVADYGLAKALEHTIASNTGAGTVAYMAPECFKGKLAQQSDQYSLAVTYFHLRTGQLLFKGDQARVMYAHLELAPDLPALPPVERDVLARALAKDPGKRWPSCKAFVNELTAAHETAVRLAAANEEGHRHEAAHGRGDDGRDKRGPSACVKLKQRANAPPPEYTLAKAVAVCLGFMLLPLACFGIASTRGLDAPLKYPVWAVTLQQKEEWRKAQPTSWREATIGEKIERVGFGELMLGGPAVVLVCWGYLATKRAERRWCQQAPGRTLAELKMAREEVMRAEKERSNARLLKV